MVLQSIGCISNRKARRILQAALVLLMLILSFACGNPCPTDTDFHWCTYPPPTPVGKPDYCCVPKGQTNSANSNCCPGGQLVQQLSEMPRPDLSYTNLDGLVDFGTTVLRVDAPDDGDSLVTNLKGRVAIVGGVCAEAQCPLQVVLIELQPIKANFTSAKGRSVSKVFVRNANIWTGTRLSDGEISMDSNSKLALEAIIDGKKIAGVLNPTSWLKGTLLYNQTRLTATGYSLNNRIDISGSFTDENNDINVTLKIVIWATNCEPVIHPSAQCMLGIDTAGPGYVHFDSDFSMLGNWQSSQDLCDALAAPDPVRVCTAGGSTEFSTFTCKMLPEPSPSNKAEIAKLLKFRWQDANGTVFSNQYSVNVQQMPMFPVTLVVENKWGKVVSDTLINVPECSSTVALAPGACAWERVSNSHQRGNQWCPKGAFLTALEFEGDKAYSALDEPQIGYARCCVPQSMQPTTWGSCSWVEIGRQSHQQGKNWCPDNAFLTALDQDSDSGLSAYDSPVIGRAQCCTLAPSGPSESGLCSWVEVGGNQSRQRGGNWCPANAFLTALDLDSDSTYTAYESPIVGRAQCCSLPPSPGAGCGVGRVYDCVGACINQAVAKKWIGDGHCDNGKWGMNLICTAFSNDNGDCPSSGIIPMLTPFIIMTPNP